MNILCCINYPDCILLIMLQIAHEQCCIYSIAIVLYCPTASAKINLLSWSIARGGTSTFWVVGLKCFGVLHAAKIWICHAHFWRRRSADSTKLVALDDHLPHSQRTSGGAMPSMPEKWWGYSPISPTVCAAPDYCTILARCPAEFM
jgi:hypothetical protein